MFINCSNHNSISWALEQRQSAEKWGPIVDYTFPAVDAEADEEEIAALSWKTAEEIMGMNPDAVMCQGEFTLTYALVTELKKRGVPVLAACSERRTVEEVLPNGETEKVSRFVFTRFRRY